jgi:hypothetical protein
VVDPVRIDSVPSLAALPGSTKRALGDEFDEVEVHAGEAS